MAELAAQPVEHGRLLVVGRGQRDMAALAADHHVTPVAAAQQPGHAQAGARAEQGQRRAGDRAAATDRTQFLRL